MFSVRSSNASNVGGSSRTPFIVDAEGQRVSVPRLAGTPTSANRVGVRRKSMDDSIKEMQWYHECRPSRTGIDIEVSLCSHLPTSTPRGSDVWHALHKYLLALVAALPLACLPLLRWRPTHLLVTVVSFTLGFAALFRSALVLIGNIRAGLC